MKARFFGLAATAAAFMVLSTTSASAYSIEDDLATETTNGSAGSYGCVSTGDYVACFAENGDWFRAEDWKADGHSAVAWWTLTNPNTGLRVREGRIWNTAGASTWRYKNKDLAEGYTLHVRACAGEYGTTTVIETTCSGWKQFTA